jgi:MFS family permease
VLSDGWRGVFDVNVPIGLIALALAAPPASTAGSGSATPHLDLVGSLVLGGGPQPGAGGERRDDRPWSVVVAVPRARAAARGVRPVEVRTGRRGRQRLLDPRLARTSGYAAGSGIGLVYFSGFTGIWLVFALFFQDGLGYSPLRSGLAVTPFALGVAVSAVIAGRLVGRIGRWLTVCGLIAMSIGLFAAALVLRNVGGDAAAWTVAGPMLVAGLGGGLVTSPNITLTLESVPVQMAGAAGGALQTAQRIGGAIGTAVLATIFYQVLIASGRDYAAAVSDALLVASGIMVLALVMAIAELIRRRPHRRNQPPPLPRPEHHLHHI